MIDKRPPIKPVIVSACLLGLKTRYNGEAAYNTEAAEAIDALEDGGAYVLPLCPEQIGGLPTPREPATIERGAGEDVLEGKARVIDIKGKDVTQAFITGAEAALDLARRTGADKAILKERSPSCGVKYIRSSSTQGEEKEAKERDINKIIEGCGVTAALLLAEGLKVRGF